MFKQKPVIRRVVSLTGCVVSEDGVTTSFEGLFFRKNQQPERSIIKPT